jgi:hypothetical protein
MHDRSKATGVISMSSSAAIKLLDLIQSHRVTAIIYVAAKLGIAELLRDDRSTNWRDRRELTSTHCGGS